MANNQSWTGPQQRVVGNADDPSAWSQMSILNNPQQIAQYGMLGRGMLGMLQQQPSFDPIRNQYMQMYREQNGPGLMNNFTGNTNGGDFMRANRMSDQSMLTNLAGLEANWKQHQFDKNREYSQGLLKEGMKPSFENVYSPIPYTAAENYLKKQGIKNPTPEQIEREMPKFEVNKPLGMNDVRNAGNYARKTAYGAGNAALEGLGDVKGIYDAYKQGGWREAGQEAQDVASSYWNKLNPPQPNRPALGEGLRDEAKADLDRIVPDVRTDIQNKIDSMTQPQKDISERVRNKLAGKNYPVMQLPLNAGQYEAIDTMTESEKPKVQKLVGYVRTIKELDELIKHFGKKSNINIRWMLRKMIRRKNHEDKKAAGENK